MICLECNTLSLYLRNKEREKRTINLNYKKDVEYTKKYEAGNCCQIESNILADQCSVCCHIEEEAYCVNGGRFKKKCWCVMKNGKQ